ATAQDDRAVADRTDHRALVTEQLLAGPRVEHADLLVHENHDGPERTVVDRRGRPPVRHAADPLAVRVVESRLGEPVVGERIATRGQELDVPEEPGPRTRLLGAALVARCEAVLVHD